VPLELLDRRQKHTLLISLPQRAIMLEAAWLLSLLSEAHHERPHALSSSIAGNPSVNGFALGKLLPSRRLRKCFSADR
jgi:hypothetical protein